MTRRADRTTIVTIVLAVIAVALLGFQLAKVASFPGKIQDERRLNVLSICREQNARHDRTIRALDRLVDLAIEENPDERAERREERDGTVLLINALAPKRDCEKRARSQVSAGP